MENKNIQHHFFLKAAEHGQTRAEKMYIQTQNHLVDNLAFEIKEVGRREKVLITYH